MGFTTEKRIYNYYYPIRNNNGNINTDIIINHHHNIITFIKDTLELASKFIFEYYFHITFFAAISSVSASSYQNFTPNGIDSGCPTTADPKCLKCNIEGCIKCPTLLITDSRRCTDNCPSGYLNQWSSNPDFMGKICLPQESNNTTYAALIGVFAGFVLCLVFLIISVVLIKRKKRRKSLKEILLAENRVDRSDFLRQLDEIRPNAEYILAMLNDTRRQIRKLHLSGETSAANSYRPIVRDLAKLLILLNRPIELIPAPPHDWHRIHSWAEKALEQYKPQVGQLIDFLKEAKDNHHLHPNYNHHIITSSAAKDVFQSSNLKNSHQMQLFGSLISLHEFDEPRSSSDPFGSSFNTLKDGFMSTSNGSNLMTNAELNASSLWLEDEFFKLGLRPQDEITTEL